MNLLRRFLLAFLILTGAPALAAGDADWLYRGSDIPRDPAWTFGTLPNGLRYAVRRNALPERQVSIRVRIDAGSLHEEDRERGWAHYIEHLAFRGTKAFGDGEGRRIWQKLGASFGSDTNAFTSPTQTVYQLDLPHADEASLDTSLHVLSEMVDSALFDPAVVDAERKVVLAEKGRRPELSQRMQETSWPLFYSGLRIADRDTIGTEATLAGATADGLRAFYERWYRPDRATVIMVGDADPASMERLIAKRFGDWRASGPPPREPDFGAIASPKQRAATLAYPGAPFTASFAWLRPYQTLPNTIARERDDLARSIGARILNRRLEAKARGEADFVNAGVGESRSTHIADMTQLSITAREGRWQEALNQSFAIVRDALRAPPSEAEIARELSNLRTAAAASVEADTTVRSPQRAQQLVNAIDDQAVVASARTIQTMLATFERDMTPARVGKGMESLFSGSGPRLMLLSPQPIAGGLPGIAKALALAKRVKPAQRQSDRRVSIDDLPPLGAPGREVSRQRIEDMDVTIVGFANGSTLTFKRTDFDKGTVQVSLRWGQGLLGLSPDQPSLAWAGGLVGPSGFANLDLDGVERLMTGRRVALGFGISEDAFELSGSTSGQELGDQLRIMATKLAHPRWDAPLFARFKTGALQSYDLAFASASARAGRELSAFTRGGDARWSPVEKAELAQAQLGDVERFFAPLLKPDPVDGIIVGDVDIETAVQAFSRTIAALPTGQTRRAAASARSVQPPAPSPTPRTYTHQGDPNQAYAVIGWSTFGGIDRRMDRRALALAANMLQVRLFERLREAEGASYSPNALSSSSEDMPSWGIFYAASELKPESAPTFFRIAREIVADLAAKPAAPDEFERAKNPVLTGIERRMRTNAYWLNALEDWVRQPEMIDYIRSFPADYQKMTAEDVRAAVARHVADAPDWSMLVVPAKKGGGGQ
ncbi:MAG TPA: insulinase family protein [Allosphingosinicella sp.]|uniref:M16 family metallopeptidase n=1 Tax=Allosphingosinicella sp. TaxID=2823234 RepID=UPI002F289A24